MPEGLDIGQVIIIAIAVVAGFIQWVWKVYQQSKADRERARESLTDEERQLREQAWQRQTREMVPAPTPPPASATPPRPSPTSTQPPHDPWSNLRDIFDTVKEEMRKAQEAQEGRERPAPAPVPAPTSPSVPRRAPPAIPSPPPLPPPSAAKPARIPPPLATAPAPAPSTPVAPVLTTSPAIRVATAFKHAPTSAIPTDDFAPLRALLASRDTVRQGILLREILGPPKALQSFADTPS